MTAKEQLAMDVRRDTRIVQDSLIASPDSIGALRAFLRLARLLEDVIPTLTVIEATDIPPGPAEGQPNPPQDVPNTVEVKFG